MKYLRVLSTAVFVLLFLTVTALAGFCPECGKNVKDEDKFCGSCGTRLSSTKSSDVSPDKTSDNADMKVIAVDKNQDADNQFELARNAIWGPKLVSKKKRAEAEKLFLDLLKRFPTCDKADDAAYWLGRIYQVNGDDRKAIEYYNKCFELNYKHTEDGLLRIAHIYERSLKDFRKAKEAYEMVLKFDKDENRRSKAQQRIEALTKKGY